MIWSSDDRPQKARAREYLFSSTNFASRTSLWLPAAQGIDLHLAFQTGILNSYSKIIAIESDPAIYAAMVPMLDRLAQKYHLRISPLAVNAPLHKYEPDQTIDFAFIDLCGTCDEEIMLWLQTHLSPRLARGADIALTCTYSKRNSTFLRTSREVLSRWNFLLNQSPNVVEILLRCALYRHNVSFQRSWMYGDKVQSMIGYKMSDIQPQRGKALYPAFSMINNLRRPTVHPGSVKKANGTSHHASSELTVAKRSTEQPLSPAQQLGKLGGAARAKNLTSERKSEIAKKAATKRWAARNPI